MVGVWLIVLNVLLNTVNTPKLFFDERVVESWNSIPPPYNI